MSAKHTPGPWIVDGNSIGAAGAGNLAYVCQSVLDGDWKANTALITAAPELLAALEALMNYVGGWDAPEGHPCSKAIAAIKKAKGE